MNKFIIKIILVLSITSSALFSGDAEGNKKLEVKFTIMTYNVLYGFNHKKSEELAISWIKSEEPNVLALQELNGFNQEKLEAVAKKWGHENAVILKSSGFPVGLTADKPIEVIEKRTSGLHHGYLHCKVSGIHYLVIHLSPSEFRKRKTEAKIITDKVKSLIESKEEVVILGDFNSLSPLDEDFIGGKPEILKRAVEKKSKNLNDGKLDFSIVKTFLNAGFKDSSMAFKEKAPVRWETVPSKIGGVDEADRIKISRRIDFILLSENLSRKAFNPMIYHDDILDKISDHYPVSISIKKE